MFKINSFHIFVIVPLLYWIAEKGTETRTIFFKLLGASAIIMGILWGPPKKIVRNYKTFIHLVHLLVIMPFLAYIAFLGRENDDFMYEIARVLALILLLIHFYEMFDNLHETSLDKLH